MKDIKKQVSMYTCFKGWFFFFLPKLASPHVYNIPWANTQAVLQSPHVTVRTCNPDREGIKLGMSTWVDLFFTPTPINSFSVPLPN